MSIAAIVRTCARTAALRSHAPMSIAALIRESLLARSAPPALPPPLALQHRLYRAVISIVPPTATSLRTIGAERVESDEALLTAFVGGDAGAFETLMQRYLGRLVDWARQDLPRSEAEDAVQNAFIALVRKAVGLRLDSSVRGYLFGLLRIEVLRAQRSLRRRQGKELDEDEAGTEIPSDEPSPAMNVLARRAHDEVAAAMLRVCTLREQEVLLFDLEDADNKVIAAALETTEGNVRVIRHRALAKLRKALTEPADRAAPEKVHGR
ncbi:MAG TPA: sigma-70 family RNA polymerase sigma factor [Kofleriaceae bacterium]|nr:sigma-70 family RNA polymerase sigma factor [Kofleriaceae bacterium]